jgi:putative DNA primase/helicase
MNVHLDPARIAKALGGVICGGHILAPGPGHSAQDRSLSILVNPHAPEGFVVNSFAGDDVLECRDYVRAKAGLEEWRPGAERVQKEPARKREPEHHVDPDALELWRAAASGGELLKTYLVHRGITLEPPPTLRQGTTVLFNRTPIPTMVAAAQAPDRRVIAVQETRLTWRGAKAPVSVPRITTGALGYAAVRLAPAGPLLGLAEGVETALSAMQLHGVACWAVLGGQRLARIALPPEVREVHLFADNDDAGRSAAEAAAKRYRSDGLSVQVRAPPEGFGDWNDVVQRSPQRGSA